MRQQNSILETYRTAWQTLRERRDYSLLSIMYRIKSGFAPDYLKILLPKEKKDNINYNLRNNKNLKVPFIHLERFRRSFILFAVKLWNNFLIEHQETATLEAFKSVIKRDYQDVNLLYYYGKQWPAVHHTRIRLGCNKLNADLYFRLHVADNRSCSCGCNLEDAQHHFFHCPNYAVKHHLLFQKILILPF